MTIDHELWRVVATTTTPDGTLNFLIAKMRSIAHPNVRSELNERRDFLGWLRVELAAEGSLNYAVMERTMGLVWDEVQQKADYDPQLREQVVPLVTGAIVTGGDTLVADDAPDGHTTTVYHFDGTNFNELGSLSENSQPVVDPLLPNYALALVNATGNAGLPTRFLELTA